MLSRRRFVFATASVAMTGGQAVLGAAARNGFTTRGVVITPKDLSLAEWPERAARAGITTIGLHGGFSGLVKFVQTECGADFFARCEKLGLQVEYEMHAMGDLLSRKLFSQNAEMFRADADGQRNVNHNCCPSSSEALAIIAGKAVEIARVLTPTTGRYYYWPDDVHDWCHCAKCKGFTACEQAVLVENAIIGALRKHVDPQARLSHLAYRNTLGPPKQVRPQEGLFVEFAPINRTYTRSIDECEVTVPASPSEPAKRCGFLDLLDANMEVFGQADAQILEYWLDVSMFSQWRRPTVKLPWNAEVMAADAKAYARHGARHVTTFAAWIDKQYERDHGAAPLEEYGRILREAA